MRERITNIHNARAEVRKSPRGERHIEKSSPVPFTYLVFGERRKDNVVIYAQSSIVRMKCSQGHR